jgi:hypothetical protein
VTDFGTKITEMQRTVELDAQDVALLDSVGFTTAYDTRDDNTALIVYERVAADAPVRDIAGFDIVTCVDDSYVPGTEILL